MLEYKLDKKHKLIIIRFKGTIVLHEISELLMNSRITGNEENYKNILMDIRYTDTKSFSELNENSRIENILNEKYKNYRFIIVGSINQLFGELGLNLRKQFKSNLKAFTSFDEAMNWINNNEKIINSEY